MMQGSGHLLEQSLSYVNSWHGCAGRILRDHEY